MILRRVLIGVVALLALVSLAQLLYWAPQMPERMASHFDLSDRVDGWMGRDGFMVLAVVLHLMMAGVFIGLPLLIERLPDAFINVPHKQHWLAPERRTETLGHMSSGLLAVGAATLLLLIVIFQGIYALNAELQRRQSAPGGVPADAAADVGVLQLPIPFVALMSLYLAVVAVTLVWMLWRFRKPA